MKYIANGRHIFDANGKQIAQCEQYGAADSIVRACNSYEGLVRALEMAQSDFKRLGEPCRVETMAAINEALAAAKNNS